MAIAHVCMQCGWDLARVRALREPHYGLNLVRCPKCGGHSTRARHPVNQGWKRFRRMDFAITVIGVRVLILALLTFLSVIAIVATLALYSELQRPNAYWPRGAGVFMIAAYGVLGPLIGTFLAAAFEHIALWKVWLGWLTWIAIVLFFVSLHGPMGSQFDPRYDIEGYSGRLGGWIIDGVKHIWLPCMLAMIGMMIAALPGILVGRALQWMSAVGRRARWRRRYRRRRLARAAVT